MNFRENVSLAFAGLMANKMRAALTMLGIIIGIASVIAIVTLGNSLNASITSQMESMGANSIIVRVNERSRTTVMPVAAGSSSSATADDDDFISSQQIDTFRHHFEDKVKTISMTQSVGSGTAKDGRLFANVSVIGVSDGYKIGNDVKMLSGRFINDGDLKAIRHVAVVSDKLVKKMFPAGEDPIGKEVRVNYAESISTYTIVGVYEYEPNLMFAGMDTSSEEMLRTNLFVPVTLAKQTAEFKNYQTFTVITNSGVNIAEFTSEITDYFTKIYRNNKTWTATAQNMERIISNMSTMLGTVQTAISAIAAISLLVGGIGVMNIMLVSVTERTREIGTRKALGAKNSNIRMQFIVESVIICVIGGVFGIILGLVMGYAGAAMLGYPAAASVSVIILSVGVTMLIGIFFGYYPANKAAKLDPIEALRYE